MSAGLCVGPARLLYTDPAGSVSVYEVFAFRGDPNVNIMHEETPSRIPRAEATVSLHSCVWMVIAAGRVHVPVAESSAVHSWSDSDCACRG